MTDDEIRQSIAEHGFLSPAVADFPAMYRDAAKGYFDMAEEFSRIGQSIAVRAMNAVPDDHRDPIVMATLLLLRTLQSFQAAVVLCERGMATEARMILRSLFENSFCVAALIDDAPKVMAAFESDEKHTQKALAKFVAQSDDRMQHLDAKTKRAIRTAASNADQVWGKVKQLAIDEIAKKSAYSDAYLMFRTLSADASHPSHRSLDRFFDRKGGEVWDFTLGPQPANIVADSINTGCLALAGVLVAFTQFVGDTEGNRDAARVLAAYAKVNDYIRSQQAAADLGRATE
jgi:hypothetical protein